MLNSINIYIRYDTKNKGVSDNPIKNSTLPQNEFFLKTYILNSVLTYKLICGFLFEIVQQQIYSISSASLGINEFL